MTIDIKGLSDNPEAIERIWLYRHILQQKLANKETHITSEALAGISLVSSSLVRRDLMMLQCMGSLAKGYDIQQIMESTSDLLDLGVPQNAAIIGVGNLGRAIMGFFCGNDPNLKIVAGFDTQTFLSGKKIHGCLCHHIKDLMPVVRQEKITVAIMTAPDKFVQEITDNLCQAGVKGILNFSHVKPLVPEDVFVEDISFGAKLEVVAFFARKNNMKSH